MKSHEILSHGRIGKNGVVPHPSQNIAAFGPSVIEGWRGNGVFSDFRSAESLIILAIEAIPFQVAESVWTPTLLLPLTTTFPSTSVVAWLSAATGLRVEQHNVPGVVYYLEEANGLFHCFRDKGYGWDDPWDRGNSVPKVRLGPWQTIFDTLEEYNVQSFVHLGDLINWPSRWVDSLFHGAKLRNPIVDWDLVRFVPDSIVESAIKEIGCTLSSKEPGKPLLVWAWLNLDDYIHLHGYDDQIIAALKKIERAIAYWTSRGHVVIAISDHGMVYNDAPMWMLDVWDAVNRRELCAYPPGGAGRVRWCYPKPNYTDVVRQMLLDGLGDHVLVSTPKELDDIGVMKINSSLRNKIGDVVVSAITQEFPVPDPSYVYEHGSFTTEEMIVPVALWKAQ